MLGFAGFTSVTGPRTDDPRPFSIFRPLSDGRPRRSTAALAAGLALAAALALAPAPAPAVAQPAPAAARPPNVLLITIDTLRPDRLSGYGYDRPTSPHLDRLLAEAARFTAARTVEPLTTPAVSSMLTSLYPHEHGATRNGLRIRHGLPSLPKVLARHGYVTAGFVANWTLRDRLSGLAEHFATYGEVLTRRRWLGLFRSEATAEDLNEEALAWLDEHAGGRRPFFLWVHYVEPHAPYLFHDPYARRLGLRSGGGAGKADRYDTEVAFVDAAVGELLDGVADRQELAADTLVVFTADHGESLGEHGVWGHGRNLFDEALRIPLAFAWPGHIAPRTVDAAALLIDLPATVLGLLGIPAPSTFQGFDWSDVLAGREPPVDRVTFYQAHKAAVLRAQNSGRAREKGLLEVALLQGGSMEILNLEDSRRLRFDLTTDPGEGADLDGVGTSPTAELLAWRDRIETGLATASEEPVDLDAESAAKLRALGYLD